MLHEAKTQVQYNIALSFDIMLPVPPVTFVKNMTQEEIDEIRHKNSHYIYKNLAIEKMDGLEVGQMAYYHKGFHLKTVVINDNYILSGRQGPYLPANCVTVFPGIIKMLAEPMKKLSEKIEEEEPDYEGFICLDIVLTKRRPYWKLIDFNPPKDYIFAMEALAGHRIETLTDMVHKGTVERPRGYGGTTRIYAYPYDAEENFLLTERNNFGNLYRMNDDCINIVGKGPNIRGVWNDIYKQIPRTQEVCYRFDGDRQARYMFNELKRCRHLE